MHAGKAFSIDKWPKIINWHSFHSTMTGPASIKASLGAELPATGLHRQNTFNKDESTAIPVRRNSFKSQPSIKFSMPNGNSLDSSSPFRSSIQSRMREPSPIVGRMLNGMVEKSPDFAKSRWSSASENNVLKIANGINSLPTNTASAPSKFGSTGLPVRRESSLRSANRTAYVKWTSWKSLPILSPFFPSKIQAHSNIDIVMSKQR